MYSASSRSLQEIPFGKSASGILRQQQHSAHSPLAGTAPARMIGAVGVAEPSAFSIVTPNAFAGTPLGKVGSRTLALPDASGLKSPAGIGACPLAGITQSSYVLLSAS